MSTPQTVGLTAADERALVAELTQAALSVAAPEEMQAYDAHADEFLDGKVPVAPQAEQQLGIGIELVGMLAPYVVAAAGAAVRLVAQALAESATSEATSAVKGWIHRLLRGDATASLPADVVQRVHAATLAVCREMGADADDATLVADAVAGRLVTTVAARPT